MQVVAIGGGFHSFESKFVGGSVAYTSFNSSTGQPGGESASVMVAAFALVSLSGELTASASSGGGGIFVSQTGDLTIDSVNAGAAHILGSQGIPNRVDSWGDDWHHDWPTWRHMLPQYLNELTKENGVAPKDA